MNEICILLQYYIKCFQYSESGEYETFTMENNFLDSIKSKPTSNPSEILLIIFYKTGLKKHIYYVYYI